MKTIIAFLLALAMMLSLTACGGEEPAIKDKTPAAAPTDAPTEPAPTEPPKTVYASGIWTEDTGNCTIEFLGAELFTDDDGEQSLRIWFDFTNRTSETLSAWDFLAYDLDIQQGGEDLPQAFCPSDAEIPEEYNKKMNIRPGTTVRCVDQKKIAADGGNVTVLLEADTDVSWELDLNDLPGAPKEPLEATVVSNPTWTNALPLEADYEENYHIRFVSAEVSKDGDGNRALRVTFEFTNNADEEKAMWRVTEFWGYQDGIGAGLVYPSYVDSTTTDNNFQDYLAPGETWMASAMFRLFTDSPLEVEIIDDKGGSGLGAVFFVGADDTVTMGEKNAEPEPTEPAAETTDATEPPTEPTPTQPAGPVKPASFTEMLTFSDGMKTTVTVHYPASFTYEADYWMGSFLSHTPYACGGILKGAEYTVDFGFVKANDYYKTVENYVKTFKGTDIYEEIEVSGLKAYVRQDKTSRLNIVICLDAERMLNVEITVPGDGSEAIYRPIWEDGIVSAIIENLEITVGEFVSETLTTDLGYVSITTTEGWYKGAPNSNYALTLLHRDNLGWVDIKDTQLGTLQQTMDQIISGYPGTVWTEMTIGSNVFQYLVTATGNVHYLAANTSSGKPFYIEVRGVPLEDVLPMLESIVIH